MPGRAEVVDAALVEIDRDPTATRGQDGAPHLKALQDRLLPLARRALLDFKMRGHVLDRAQKLEVEHVDAIEHVMASGIVEGERSHALFDHRSAAAVLDLVEQRSALALPAQQARA